MAWQRLPQATAKDFDTGLYLLSVALDTLHWRNEVDSEDTMARQLVHADERFERCMTELRRLGETEPPEAVASGIANALAPVRDHLARVRAAPCVHGGANRVLKVSPEEYLILCAECRSPAERLRLRADTLSFSRRTGAVPAPEYPRERAAAIFSTLDHGGAGALCAGLEDGGRKIIGYCPDCRVLYCPAHYEALETWSGSRFDTLYGTCAKGHRRELA
jgi:hypothetical protein